MKQQRLEDVTEPSLKREAARKVPKTDADPNKVFAGEGPTPADLAALAGLATEEAAIGLVSSALEAMGTKATIYREFMMAMYAEEEPRTLLEAMLLTQMGAVHIGMMKMSRELQSSNDSAVCSACAKSLDKLAGTFAEQMMKWKKYRSRATQTVRVEKVTVNEGGQAIVGDAIINRGGGDEN